MQTEPVFEIQRGNTLRWGRTAVACSFGSVLLLFTLLLPAPVFAQLDPLELLLQSFAPDLKIERDRAQLIIDPKSTEFVGGALLGNVALTSPDLQLYADAIGCARVEIDGGEDGGSDSAQRYGVRLFAIGNILLVRGRQSFRGETLVFDTTTRKGCMTDARIRIDVGFIDSMRTFLSQRRPRSNYSLQERALPAEPDKVPAEAPRLVMAAQLLSVDDFQKFVGEDVSITSCDFGDPHWRLSSRHAQVERIRDPGGDPDLESSEYTVAKLSGTWLEIGGWPIIPFPNLSWNSRWTENGALESVSYSSSSKFGNRADTLWDGNVLLPHSWRRHLDLGLRLDYLSRRGLGWGADLRYGRAPSYWGDSPEGWIESYGEGTFYAIHDRGTDRNNRVPEHDQRNRARLHHRSRLATGTWIDLEYAVERDRNFLLEYFEQETRNQKAPENIVYVRHPLGDDAMATLLVKRQLASYRSVVERIPELGFDLFEHALWDSPWNLDLSARATQLQFVPDRALTVGSERNLRGDLRATIARAVGEIGGAPYIKVRPFFESRFTTYEEDLARRNERERLALATGGSISTHLSRDFWPTNDVFGWRRFRHVIDPEVRYRAVFENNVPPVELFTFDPVDTVDRFEILTLSVRNYLYAARQVEAPILLSRDGTPLEPPTPGVPRDKVWDGRALVETEIEIDYFPDSPRDNSRNDWGPLLGEALINPTPWLGLYVDGRYDAEIDQRLNEFNSGIEVRTEGGSRLRVENRYRKHLGHSLILQGRWNPSEKYAFEGYYEYDFRRQQAANMQYSVIRHFHRWACVFSLEVDEGEQDDIRFTVNFGPRELISSLTRDARDR